MKLNPHNTPAEPASEPAARSQELLVIDPRSGELLGNARNIEALGDETVADVRVAIKERIGELRKMLEAVDTDLARRLEIRGRRRMVAGDFEVSYQARRESVWDADELEDVVRGLLDSGVLAAGEVTGLITHETKVSRSQAQRLVDRLGGGERRAVEACRTWREAGRRSVDVVRSIELFKS